MKVQDRLMQARVIEIYQVLVKKIRSDTFLTDLVYVHCYMFRHIITFIIQQTRH